MILYSTTNLSLAPLLKLSVAEEERMGKNLMNSRVASISISRSALVGSRKGREIGRLSCSSGVRELRQVYSREMRKQRKLDRVLSRTRKNL